MLSETPAFFQKELKNQEAVEGEHITLRCELSKPGVTVQWRKGGVVLQSGRKYTMKQDGHVQELRIHYLDPEDNGYYTCDAGAQLTTASVTVQGNTMLNLSQFICHFPYSWTTVYYLSCFHGAHVPVWRDVNLAEFHWILWDHQSQAPWQREDRVHQKNRQASKCTRVWPFLFSCNMAIHRHIHTFSQVAY